MRGLWQPARTTVGSSQSPGGRLEDDRPARPQGRDVRRRGRVLPHLSVHGGHEHDRAPRGQQHVGKQIGGEPGRGPRQQVSGGRCDQHKVGLLPEPHVLHLRDLLPRAGADRVAGQGFPGRGADEVQRIGRRDDLDLMARLCEQPEQLTDLVGGDPSAYPEYNAHQGPAGAMGVRWSGFPSPRRSACLR